MKLFRKNEIVIDDEIRFYASILAKRLVKGTEAAITIDEFISGELREKWTRDDPELVLAWEKHCIARQKAKKAYDQIENEAIGLSPELEVNHVQ